MNTRTNNSSHIKIGCIPERTEPYGDMQQFLYNVTQVLNIHLYFPLF